MANEIPSNRYWKEHSSVRMNIWNIYEHDLQTFRLICHHPAWWQSAILSVTELDLTDLNCSWSIYGLCPIWHALWPIWSSLWLTRTVVWSVMSVVANVTSQCLQPISPIEGRLWKQFSIDELKADLANLVLCKDMIWTSSASID